MNSSLRLVSRINSYCRRHALKTVISRQPARFLNRPLLRLLCTAIPEPHVEDKNKQNQLKKEQLEEDISKRTLVEEADSNKLSKDETPEDDFTTHSHTENNSNTEVQSKMSEEDDGCIVRIRGLPWSTTTEEVLKFFEGSNICGGENGIHFMFSRGGRLSGEAFIEFESPDDVENAMGKHKNHMGSRYLEVFPSERSEMEFMIKSLDDSCVQLRGLPYTCTKEDIAEFFSGLEIVPNGIILPKDRQGRSTGEAYVQFANQTIAERSLGKHKERIGHRYIEIFKTSGGEEQVNRRGSEGEQQIKEFDNDDSRSERKIEKRHAVFMRGLPFQAEESDIQEFFSPLRLVKVEIKYTSKNKPTGRAFVDFESHDDAVEAMKRDKENMQHRYVELKLKSTPEDNI